MRHAVQMAKAMHHDIPKMKAFVRNQQVAGIEPEQFVAWFEPQHLVVSTVAPSFERDSEHALVDSGAGELGDWDGAALGFAPGRPATE